MITELDALGIGREYCNGTILKQECCPFMISPPFPDFYEVVIWHEDEDKNIHKSTLKILCHNGSVIYWEKGIIKYGEVD